MPILPVTRYRVSVERSDGRTVSATTTTPDIAEHNAEPINENCITPVTISYKQVDRENFILMNIRFFLRDIEYVFTHILKPPSTGEYDGEVSLTIEPATIINQAFIVVRSKSAPDVQPGATLQEFNPCANLKDGKFDIDYTHFGPDYELGRDNTNISDSLRIPGGAGSFIGVLRDSFSFPIDTTDFD